MMDSTFVNGNWLVIFVYNFLLFVFYDVTEYVFARVCGTRTTLFYQHHVVRPQRVRFVLVSRIIPQFLILGHA